MATENIPANIPAPTAFEETAQADTPNDGDNEHAEKALYRIRLNESGLKVMEATNTVYALHKLLNQATTNGMGGLRPLAVTVEERQGLMHITENACKSLREAMSGLCDLYEYMGGVMPGQEQGASHE